jgi:hypothetical protein
MTRQENNRELLYLLEDLIQHNPDMRFSQILQSFGFVKPQRPTMDQGRISWQNEFNIEPGDLLVRVNHRIDSIENQSKNNEEDEK